MSDGIAMVKMLLGLPGMDVLEVIEVDNELVIRVETSETVGWCPGCGARAQSQDRTTRSVRDLSCFGRAVRLEVLRRRWRCREVLCEMKTWTEDVEQLDATAVLTRRAGAEACRQVGQQARPVAAVAREFEVYWWTVMNAVIEHGTPLVDSPDRVGTVRKLGVDETSFQAARPGLATQYVTGLVDLERRAMIDMTAGNTAADLRRWCANSDPAWLAKIELVATDLAESYRAGLSPHLDHCVRVADPFHVVRVANRCMDTVRRRVQNEQLGHRGRKRDPLFKIRKILLAGSERVTPGGGDRDAARPARRPPKRRAARCLAREGIREGCVCDRRRGRRRGLVGQDHRRLHDRRRGRDPLPRADIAVANRVAHDVLGRSLDELPPQTRRLLDLLHDHVTVEAGDGDRSQVRFTRRQVRERCGWGDTQLKVHLARLVDLELVTAHRGDNGVHLYELSWDRQGVDGSRFVMGLTDPATLVDKNDRSGSDRGPVGPRSGSGRNGEVRSLLQLTGRESSFGFDEFESHCSEQVDARDVVVVAAGGG